MFRSLSTVVRGGTWRHGVVPPEVQGLTGVTRINVLGALLHTAMWTRPPRSYGFLLGDLWAWLRYLPAFASKPELRLREEWSEVDSHQKTILSDEVAVGVLTYMLAEQLDCIEFVEPSWALKSIYGRGFRTVRRARRGPSKTPDYIARLPGGRFLILECKGTQTSPHALATAMRGGRAQKRNLQATTARVLASVVGGVYIPQWSARAGPEVIFEDPTWKETLDAVEAAGREEVELATVQIAVAKLLSLAGAVHLAGILGETPLDALDGVWRASRNQLRATPARQTVLTGGRRHGQEAVQERITFRIDAEGLLDRLMQNSATDALRSITAESAANRWEEEVEEEKRTEITTPHGVKLSLAWGETET